MTGVDLDALDALERRLDHAAAIARMVGEGTADSVIDNDVSIAIRGIAELIADASERLAAIVRPAGATAA